MTPAGELLAGADFTDQEAAAAVEVVDSVSGRRKGHWYVTGGTSGPPPTARPYRGHLRVRVNCGGLVQVLPGRQSGVVLRAKVRVVSGKRKVGAAAGSGSSGPPSFQRATRAVSRQR